MRILHVVTYVSVEGGFGGPLAVARSQTTELARRGHEVLLLAGWDGKAQFAIPGVRVRLMRARRLGGRLATLTAPSLWFAARRAAKNADIVHIHMGRDFVTLGAAVAVATTGARVFIQPHGMVIPDERPIVRALDALFVRRVLRRAAALLALTSLEAGQLTEIAGPGARVERLNNGIASLPVRRAAEDGHPRDVLFLARLQARKRVLTFAEAAYRISITDPDVRFSVVGPDEGDLRSLLEFVEARGLTDRLVYEGALPGEQVRERLRKATVYVLPSVREVFPVTVLEALDEGVPTVVTESCGIADELDRLGAATVVGTDAESLTDGIRDLLVDAGLRARRTAAGLDAVKNSFSIGPVVDRLAALYESGRRAGG